MKVVLVPGDGIGKEVSKSVMEVSKALDTNIEFIEYKAGASYYEESGQLLEDGLLDAIKENHLCLKGPTATPIGKGFHSINVLLRQHFNLYANLRPLSSLKGVKSRYENVDLTIVRENSEDLYKGVEYMYDNDTAHSIKIITREASNRIIRFAFDYALKNNKKKVTCVHKANIMKLSDGLFLNAFNEIAKEYPSIESNSVIVDAVCMKLVTNPNQFDVLVAPNLYGDIISDLCAGLVGGLGFAPGVNVGKDVKIYEAVHGSAPDIAGKDLANPTALLLSFAMLLNDNGMEDKTGLLREAIYKTIEEGKHTTVDIGGNSTCSDFTKEVCRAIYEENR